MARTDGTHVVLPEAEAVLRLVASSTRTGAVERAALHLSAMSADLDGLARLAAQVAGTGVGLVGLLAPDVQTFVGRSSPDLPASTRYPLGQVVCAHVVARGRPLVVPDCRADPRFAGNPEVVAGRLGFYAGVPVTDADGEVLGTVCALDALPHGHLDDGRLAALVDIASQVGTLLARGRRAAEQSAQRRVLAAVAAGRPLEAVLDLLVREVEALFSSGVRCSVRLGAGAACPADGHEEEFCASLPVLGSDGQVLGAFALFRDPPGVPAAYEWATLEDFRDLTGLVIERSRAQAQLTRLATRDTVTGLLNRAAFLAQAERALVRPPARGREHVLLLCDMDRFKQLNDSLGSGPGDEYLRVTGNRLQAWLRPGDLVCRYGGDAFAVLALDVPPEEAGVLAQTASAAFAAPVRLAGHDLRLSASVGMTTSAVTRDAGGAGQQVEAMLSDADLAMHAAKDAGRARVRRCDAALQARARFRSDLVLALRQAIDRGETTVAYQPEVEVATGRILGVEALCRWWRPGHGAVSPAEFVPLAEQAGLVVALGQRVLETAVADLASWRSRAPEARDVTLWVNVSAHQLGDLRLLDTVAMLLRRHRVPADRLGLEVTESAVMAEPGAARTALQALRRLGVRIAIDDFGTGWSSLSALKELPVDLLKIDRSFVTRLHEQESDEQIVTAVIAMAGALGLPVIAEGVERPEQLAVLRRLGSPSAQGFLLGRPKPAAETELLLAAPVCLPR
ncbi:hypothetical protein NUM3379_29640 [Kineococcus sp. NUM-3379]